MAVFRSFVYISWRCDILSVLDAFIFILGESGYPSSQLPDNRTIQNFVEDYVEEYVG